MWGIFVCSLIALCITAIWYGARLPFFTISAVHVEGGETISHDEVRALVEAELRGAYLLLIPHTFTYLYPEEHIMTALREIPRIHDILLSREGNTLRVSFSEYRPYALHCLEGGEQMPCYFLTEDGYAFTPAPTLSGGALVRHIVEGKEEIRVGDTFDSARFTHVHTFIERLNTELRLRVTEVLYTKDGDMTLRVNGGGMLLMSPTHDMDTAFNNLVTVLTSAEFKHIEPGNFNYIDLRFGNKVFVNEETEPEVAVASTTTADGGGTSSSTLPE